MSLHDLSDLLGSDAVVSLASPSVVTPPGASAVVPGGVSHDGSKITDNLALWSPPLRSADADILPEKNILDARSRSLALNDSYISSGADFIRDSIVGSQYRLSPQPETKVLWGNDDEKWESEYQEEVSVKFSLWAESRRKWADASRRQTLTGLVRLSMSQYMLTGEVLATGEWFDPKRFNRPYGSCIQMVDPDRLSDPGINYDRNRRIRRGVERTSSGMPIAYWIRNGHPSDLRFADPDLQRAMTWTRVPREKPWGRPMVLHAFDQDRADLARRRFDESGVPGETDLRLRRVVVANRDEVSGPNSVDRMHGREGLAFEDRSVKVGRERRLSTETSLDLLLRPAGDLADKERLEGRAESPRFPRLAPEDARTAREGVGFGRDVPNVLPREFEKHGPHQPRLAN